MAIYTEQHYRKLIAENPYATVGFILAARAVYAARYGAYDSCNGGSPRFNSIAKKIANRYGEALNTNELKLEMDMVKQKVVA